MRMFARAAGILGLLCLSMSVSAAEELPSQFRLNSLNGSTTPVVEDGVITFNIKYAECSDVDYGDGRGESDCRNGNVRSNLEPKDEQRIGQTVEYAFDLWIDPSLEYKGYANEMAVGMLPNSWDSRLRVAHWEGNMVKGFIYKLNLDATNGVTFLGNVCQTPSDFGKWVRFSMKVKWTADERGWVRVACDGRTIFADEGIATDQNPHCYIRNDCDPDRPGRHPSRISFVPGVTYMGYGFEWKEHGYPQFWPIPEGGITVKMQNLKVIQGAELYGPEDTAKVKILQETLNSLGCDVGTPDGVVGRRTREAARSCRSFEQPLPAKLTVLTLPDFVRAYSGLAGVS
jgi:hypothetical protein